MQVSFAPGQQQQTVQVNTVSDARYEREESFTAILSLVSDSEGVMLGSQDTATATILDDDRERIDTTEKIIIIDVIMMNLICRNHCWI